MEKVIPKTERERNICLYYEVFKLDMDHVKKIELLLNWINNNRIVESILVDKFKYILNNE